MAASTTYLMAHGPQVGHTTYTKPIRVLPQIFSMDQTQTGIYFSALECRPVISLHP